MDKKVVNQLLPYAVEAWTEIEAKQGKISKAFRGYIANFGAAVTTGSLLAAVAFISAATEDRTKAKREHLAKVLLLTLKKAGMTSSKTLFDYVADNTDERLVKQQVLNAAIAAKLALNVFELIDDKTVTNDK